MLTFEQTDHIYKWNGVVVPSVTQVISTFLPMFDSELVRRAGVFGSALHKTLELYDRDDLGEYDPVFEPYIAAWQKFKDDILATAKRPMLVDIKSGVYSKRWDIQTAAYEILINHELLSIKEPLIESRKYHGLLGYAGTIDRFYPQVKDGEVTSIKPERMCVVLQDSGHYKIYPMRNPVTQDFAKFQSMLNVYNIRKEFNFKGELS